jgi:dTDP-4-dehydrorhamnose reductase
MILVFGKNGQVGHELSKLQDTRCLRRDEANLEEPESCAEKIRELKPSVVINAAAYTAVDRAEGERDLAFQVNAVAPGVIARTCADLSLPLIHISTDYVFPGGGINPHSVNAITGPRNVYGESKLAGEIAVRAAGGCHAILRTSWVFSAHGSNFVKTMLKLSETSEALSIVSDQIGGPTAARDIASTAVELASQLLDDESKSGTYHYSGFPDVSWCEFAGAIFNLANRNIEVNPIMTSEYPTPATRPLNSRLDCEAMFDKFLIKRPDWWVGLKDVIVKLEAGQ